MSLSVGDILQMNADQLQQQLKNINEDSSGNKKELQERMINIMQREKSKNDDNMLILLTGLQKQMQQMEDKVNLISLPQQMLSPPENSIKLVGTTTITQTQQQSGVNSVHASEAEIKPVGVQRLGKLLPTFNGECDKFQTFMNKVYLIMRSYEPNEDEFKIEVIDKLIGKAADWFHSKAEHITYSLTNLLEAMRQMYDIRPSNIEQRRKFEQRKWKTHENFVIYYQDKVTLANYLEISDREIIDYIIEGMNNIQLQSQARMQRFGTKEDLLEAMRNLTAEERGINQQNKSKSGVTESKAMEQPNVQNRSRQVNCYNCGKAGHVSSQCNKPKRPYGSCMSCGLVGHRMNECPTKNNKTMQSSVRSLSNSQNKQHSSVNYCSDQNISVINKNNNNHENVCENVSSVQSNEVTEISCDFVKGSKSKNGNSVIKSISSPGIFLEFKLFM